MFLFIFLDCKTFYIHSILKILNYKRNVNKMHSIYFKLETYIFASCSVLSDIRFLNTWYFDGKCFEICDQNVRKYAKLYASENFKICICRENKNMTVVWECRVKVLLLQLLYFVNTKIFRESEMPDRYVFGNIFLNFQKVYLPNVSVIM